MATFPDLDGPSFPEDMRLTASIAPIDDDGEPAELDSAPAWSGSDNAVVVGAADGMSATIEAVDSAKSGDTITATVTAVSEGDTMVQNYNFLLTAGGVAGFGGSFSAPVKKA